MNGVITTIKYNTYAYTRTLKHSHSQISPFIALYFFALILQSPSHHSCIVLHKL